MILGVPQLHTRIHECAEGPRSQLGHAHQHGDANQGCSHQDLSRLSREAQRLVTRQSPRHLVALPVITGETRVAATWRPSKSGDATTPKNS
jgi:hypothetical protein